MSPTSTARRPSARTAEPWDLVIFEGYLPATLPRTPILAIAPPRTSALGEVTGTLTNPGIGTLDPDEPVLRYVDLSTTHIAEASSSTRPTGRGRSSRAARRAAAVRGHPRRAADRASSRSSRAVPTCRSRSRSRSCSPT